MNDNCSKGEETALVRCEKCGHWVPAMNLQVHCAACRHQRRNHEDIRIHETANISTVRDNDDDYEEGIHDEIVTAASREEETAVLHHDAVSMMELCETCGRRIPSMNMLIHHAVCHKERRRRRKHLPILLETTTTLFDDDVSPNSQTRSPTGSQVD